MPFFGGFQYSINNNRIVYVADVVIPAAYKITVDHIEETTAAHGTVFNSEPDLDAGVNLGDNLAGAVYAAGVD